MSERTTGASDAQIDAAAERRLAAFPGSRNAVESEEVREEFRDAAEWQAEFLVPPTARIVDDWDAFAAAVREVLLSLPIEIEWYEWTWEAQMRLRDAEGVVRGGAGR